MRSMHDAPDLDLLRTFDVIYRERHLTRAAARLGRSQPAVSRALARLRKVFADPLFVKTPHGVTPTARAEALAPEVEAVLERLSALVTPARFDPATLERTFVIATSDFVEQHLVGGVVDALLARAPRTNIAFRPFLDDVVPSLSRGEVDLALGLRSGLPAFAIQQHLFDDRFVCVVRKDHPKVRGKLSLRAYAALPHIQIAPRGKPGGPVDDALSEFGLSRRVAVRTHSFLAATLLVSRSDLVLTAPSRVLVPLARQLRLRVLPPPLEVPGFAVHQAWHPRAQDDPAHRWFRTLVADVVKGR